ncbi:2-dehydropantoate 2-reductase [Shewanella sp. A32]|uniref:ketopantoate reductase family protein n=1 Tax=Shewanella sp. A32 TaxID=3031327 RepID=UPI0023B9E77E|nr:2-dehydropantoate 2-reductase [Shewanella sp. A32]MDF0534044.1 2-dehydropantoate 2-reductase [Shewanella sp. A32]
MKITVIGAGGVGGYFGGKLAAAGVDVSFVARGAHLQAMQQHGLKINSPLGNIWLPEVKAVAHPAEAADADLFIVAVKLWDTEAVAAQLQPLLSGDAAVLSLQNGVQKDEILQRYIPMQNIIGGVSYIAASIAEPGVIHHGGKLQKLAFGEYDQETSARCEAFQHCCQLAGIETELSDDIAQRIWEKFVFLVGLSGTTSLFRNTIGPIRQNKEKRDFLLQTMQEVITVANAKGVPLHQGFAEHRLKFTDTLPDDMPSSMKIDLDRGKRLELPWLSGAVVEMANSLNIAVPANQHIVDELAPWVMGAANH